MVALTEPSTTLAFDHRSLAGEVRFGPGRLGEIAEVLDARGLTRVLLVDGLEVAVVRERLARLMGHRLIATLEHIAPHVPVADADAARALVRREGLDGVVALGGGSATGLAKAIALTDAVEIVALPTTYAGSEMTPIWGLTEGERKTTGHESRVAPRAVIYDPELTYSLPARATAASGMNALAHCAEALWSERATPLTDALAGEAIGLLATGLTAALARPADAEARSWALRGAWLGGICLAGAGTALHHKLCHVLGGLGMPHAETHAAVLPEVTAFLAPAVPRALARIAAALGTADAVDGLRALRAELGLDATLADLGLRSDQVELVAELGAAASPRHPWPATRDDVLAILRAAGAPVR